MLTPLLTAALLMTVPSPTPEAAPTATESHSWYGGAAVTGDLTALALLAPREYGPALLSLLIYGTGAPVSHFVHGHPDRAAVSFGLRALALGLTYEALEIAKSGCPSDCDRYRSVGDYGVFIPVIAMIIDDVWLAREPVPPRPRATFGPNLVVTPNVALVGLSGSF